MPGGTLNLRGVRVHPGYLSPDAQTRLLGDLRQVIKAAPLFHPETARGQKMSVRMTSAGQVGWVSDRRGYRYDPRHPSGSAWPAIPATLLRMWADLVGRGQPDTCLINFYGDGARMGLHQDRDETDTSWPVVSLSLGDDALFRVGGTIRGGKTESIWLKSGDVAVLEGAARMAYHGVDRIRFGSSTLLPKGGRVNVTLRVAGVASDPGS